MITLLAFLLTIAILVIVHEYGHYLAARLSGVKVLKFSVGFGRTLISKRLGRDGTEWAICALPLGGYVKMLDEREGEVAASEAHCAFNRASVWRRMIIVVAGPLANFLLAAVVFWVLFVHGIPALKPVIGEPEPNTPAALAGLHNGDEITRVEGTSILTFANLQLALLESAARQETSTIDLANGQRLEVDFSQFSLGEAGNGVAMGIRPYAPPLDPVVGRLEPGSPAERAGLKAGDRVLTVNGAPVTTWQDFANIARANAEREIVVQVLSDGQQKVLRMTPASVGEDGKRIGRVGVAPKLEPAVLERWQTVERYSPLSALSKAMGKTWDTAAFSLKMFGRMLLGQVSWRNLSGPVSIADYAGQSAQVGWISFLGFLAVISIGLGVVNLLPIPLLDGGHLMYYIVEVFRGRPVSERVMELGARTGMAVIGALIFIALYNDMLRLLNG